MKEFAKQKALASPITTVPSDSAKFFDMIDKPKKQPVSKLQSVIDEAKARKQLPEPTAPMNLREQPEVSADNLNQPISITL